MHGANRLGGNSLLEIIIFGKEAGENAASFAQTANDTPADSTQLEQDKAWIDAIFNYPNKVNFYNKRDSLGRSFYKNAGIKRNESELKILTETVQQMRHDLPQMGIGDKKRNYNTNLIDRLEFENALRLGEVLLAAAFSRYESRGAHYREDYPEQDDEKFERHSRCCLKNGRMDTGFERSCK